MPGKQSAKSRIGRSGTDPAGYVCNLVPSKGTDTDWSIGDSVQAGMLAAPAKLPAQVDLRAPWWTIGDQEATGSCVGWAAAAGLCRRALVDAGRIGSGVELSPRFTWMASKETDTFTSRPETFIEEAGTSLKAAVDIARTFGLALEADLPFHLSTAMFSGSENAFFAGCASRKITAYFNLQRDPAAWRAWLAGKGPVLVGLNVDAAWDNATATDGVVGTFQPETVRGGHAVCLVGYRPDGRFIVRNSWGTGWGDQGFGYIDEDYIASALYQESYGVTI